MANGLDLGRLRELVDIVAGAIAHAGPHRVLPDAFTRVGLPVPDEDGTETERAQRSVAALSDDRLPEIARLVAIDIYEHRPKAGRPAPHLVRGSYIQHVQ